MERFDQCGKFRIRATEKRIMGCFGGHGAPLYQTDEPDDTVMLAGVTDQETVLLLVRAFTEVCDDVKRENEDNHKDDYVQSDDADNNVLKEDIASLSHCLIHTRTPTVDITCHAQPVSV